jgi:hypothetical protein
MANGNGVTPNTQAEESVSPLREKIFSNPQNQRQFRRISFFGADVEFRQPTIGTLLDAKDQKTSKDQIIRSIIDCAYDPKTGQRIFQETDFASIAELPWSKDMESASQALNELTGLDFKPPSSSSEAIPSSSQ